jgi:glycosyltransferase involved in cell wall biosynthesis
MTKIFAVMMVKDEIDIIGYNIEYLQTQNIDHIFVANNLSTDGTKEKLLELSDKYKNMTVFDDNEFAYYQPDKMNEWISRCYKLGADIIVPIDADEIWYSKVGGKTLGQVLKESDGDIFLADSIDFIPTKNDLDDENPIKSMCYRKQNSNSFAAVAFRKYPGSYLEIGNHDVLNHRGKRVSGLIGIRHYQYRSFDQFYKKVLNGKKVYDNTTYPNYMGSHWRTLGSQSEQELKQWWDDYVSQPVEYFPFNYD